ncbi:chaperone protein dnaJ 11, chloroplastic [Punica granatum]|uniref:J domain-containing protein n=2 Tax=Punica granatum TaxID=22663 RepID=A0A218XLQ7_PUNGR|nr:chaperone protein dnaJ 11, chloroplastic [Punica granatum]OWM85927.1 hypothetical protein CDL15_Pgr012177 [Punica granatum]PKI78827.1 hypothetical protein CRG98_000787 [Punica granatum]
MFGALTLPLPPASSPTGASSFLSSVSPRASSTMRMPVRCHATCHAPPLAEISLPAAARRRPASLYEVLQVKRTATTTEIKTAYRALAKLYHPDALSQTEYDDGRDFIEIHSAYETLSDPAARALYDLSLGRAHLSPGGRAGFYPSRRWETDQCW